MSKQDLLDKLVGPKNECPPKLTKLFFERERVSTYGVALDDNSLSSDEDTNQFLI